MSAVELKAITKRFGQVVANDAIDFCLESGEIQALLGENGAGKTTLMRILYGLYSADNGRIYVGGNEVFIRSPKDAIRAGIGMVTQHFTLVPTLTVAENIVLGYKPGFRLNPKEIKKEVGEAARRFGIDVDPGALIRHLSVGERQRVEILKSLYREAHILILDEPTAVLVPQEVDVLFETLRRLRQDGMSLVFISHKLNEVMAICDRITVLRAGKRIGTISRSEATREKLAGMMVGRENFGVSRIQAADLGKVLLRVDHLSANDKKGLPALKDVSLEVHSGEILGVAGVSGNGQTELGQALSGMLKPTQGQICVGDRDLTGASPDEFTAARVGRIPEDRQGGLIGELSVAENLALESLSAFTRSGLMDKKAILENARVLIKQYQIKALPNDRTRTLSGGNLQKVLFARALSRNPRVVIACQPTRGLDIGATDYIRERLIEQRNLGAGVLLISEDLDEVLALSDRIAVIYEGEIVGILAVEATTVSELGLLMSGAKVEAGENANTPPEQGMEAVHV